MPILRAGPWASSESPFENPVGGFTEYPDTFPVNANNQDWVIDPWEMVWAKSIDSEFDSAGTVGLGELVSMNETGQQGLDGTFYYQAAQSFDIEFNWDMGDSASAAWSWSWTSLDGETNDGNDSETGTGTETITIPASPLGIMQVGIVDQEGDNNISISIS